MKKLLIALVFSLLILLPYSVAAQQGESSQRFTIAGPAAAINLVHTSIAYHQLTWNVSGTVSACEVALDTSTNGTTWVTGGAIPNQLCTSNGSSSVVNIVANYVRIDMTSLTLTGGSSVTVTWDGWINNPAGGGTISSCSTTGGVAYENGTANTLTCSTGEIINNSSRQELAIGKGVTNIVDSGASGISIVNSGGPNNSFALIEEQDANGSYAMSIKQAGRAAGGVTMQGSMGTVPGALEVGIFGIVNPSALTEFFFTPDGGTTLYGPANANILTFNNALNSAAGGFIGSNDTNGVFYAAAGDGIGNSVETDYDYKNGRWTLLTGTGVQALRVDSSQNALFSNDISSKSIHCGILNTTACIFTGYGSTSGTATITWPAVAGTVTNPINFSNYVGSGIDNSVAGGFQAANGSANAHTIFGSAATTTNTILGFATAPATNNLPKCVVSSTTCTLTASLSTDNGTTFSYAGAGGIGVPSDGTHAGEVSLTGNTTAPAIPSNAFGFIGPNSASFTSYFLQPSTTAPSANFLQCAAPSSNISACTWATPAGTGANTALSNLAAVAINAALNSSVAGAASTPSLNLTGAPFTGGSGTTTVPLVYINDGTAPTTWSTSGTELGINAPTGFGGNFLDFHLNGGASLFAVSPTGAVTNAASMVAGNLLISTNGTQNPSYASANGHLVFSGTPPTISSGFGSGASISYNNGTAAFGVNVGTGGTASTGVIGLPTANAGWSCFVAPDGAPQAAAVTYAAPTSSSSVTLTNYTLTTGIALAWTTGLVFHVSCFAR